MVTANGLVANPESTFGAELHIRARSSSDKQDNEQSSSEREKAGRLAGLQQQMQAMKQEYESLRHENQNLQVQLARAEQSAGGQATSSSANPGNLSHRSITQKSADKASEGGLSTSGNSAQKQKIRDLEMRLKASQENIKTLSQTLNETQSELENLVRDHEQINIDLKQQL